MAEANRTSTPRKSQTLPPNTHLSPVPGSSSGNGNFLTKIKRIFRINSKGKYDLAPDGIRVKSKRKNDNLLHENVQRPNLATRSSSVRASRNRSDKEEVILLSNGSFALKNKPVQLLSSSPKLDHTQNGISSSSCTDNDTFDENLLDNEPGYESLDEIRRKVVNHRQELSSNPTVQRSHSEKLPPSSREILLEKPPKAPILNKSSYCRDHVIEEGSRDSGLGSPRPGEHGSGRHASSITSSVFSDTTVSIGEPSIELRELDGNKSLNRPNSCPYTKKPLEIQTNDNIHHSQLVFSDSNPVEIEDSLYANSSILIRKRSQYQSNKSVTSRKSSEKPSEGKQLDTEFKILPNKCVSESNLTKNLNLSRCFDNSENIPPPLPQRQYSKAEADVSKKRMSASVIENYRSEPIESMDSFLHSEFQPVSSSQPRKALEEDELVLMRNGCSIYEDIDSARESARALAAEEHLPSTAVPNLNPLNSLDGENNMVENLYACPKEKLLSTSTGSESQSTIEDKPEENSNVEISTDSCQHGPHSNGCDFDSVEDKRVSEPNISFHPHLITPNAHPHTQISTNSISSENISNNGANFNHSVSAQCETNDKDTSMLNSKTNIDNVVHHTNINTTKQTNHNPIISPLTIDGEHPSENNPTGKGCVEKPECSIQDIPSHESNCINNSEQDTKTFEHSYIEENESLNLETELNEVEDFYDVHINESFQFPVPLPEEMTILPIVDTDNSNSKSSINERPVSSSIIEVVPTITSDNLGATIEDDNVLEPTPSRHQHREMIHVSWSELQNQIKKDSASGGQDEAGHGDEDDKEEEDTLLDTGDIKRRDFLENMRQLRDCGWYWGPLSYEEAEATLLNKPDGSFLVRDSSNENYILSLSFISHSIVRHTRIEHNKGRFSFWSQPESHGRVTIKEFIEQTVENSRNGNFHYFLRPPGPGMPPLPIQLVHPISRFVQFRSLQHMCRFLILRWVRRDHIDRLPVPEKVKNYLRENQYYVESVEDV